LPALGAQARAAGATRLTAWSVGCASGEEPYTLVMLWRFLVARRLPTVDLRILATDIDDVLLERARRACYPRGAMTTLPRAWVAEACEVVGNECRLKPVITRHVRFARHDVRRGAPDGSFDLVLCRNLAFTYFDDCLQRVVAAIVHGALREEGALVLGSHEALPDGATGFTVWSPAHKVYRKQAIAAS
jgi:chemotaxis protein methyltransferase CheR